MIIRIQNIILKILGFFFKHLSELYYDIFLCYTLHQHIEVGINHLYMTIHLTTKLE
jgi:hypothetical protein